MARRMLITQGTTLQVKPMSDGVALDASRDEEVIAPASTRGKVAAYVALTKPRIIELLLITTVPAMIVAERGLPSPWLMLATVVGGTLAAGGANAINCYIDRDIDGVMHRTRKRPLPAHKVAPASALMFGAALGAIGFLFLWATVNLASAVLATSALLFYVFVYTLVLKRSTPQNIVIGGAAGAVPALVGWSAVTGTVDWPALIMFGIIFYWTPPHFWALAMRYEREYARANVPMMPVVYGRDETAKHIVLYSFLLLAMCLALFSVGRMGLVYLATAVVLNVIFVAWSVKLWRDPTTRRAWGLFKYSIYYLAVLFVAMAVDQLLYVQV
jgi:protoheme IX farnesyltransferase